jgi:hypothetical protein
LPRTLDLSFMGLPALTAPGHPMDPFLRCTGHGAGRQGPTWAIVEVSS